MRHVRWQHVTCLAIGAVAAAALTYHLMRGGDVRHEITAVDPGILYRSGQLTAEELKREIHERGIKTVINLGSRTDWDTEVCATEGVEYIDLPVGDVWSLCGVAAPGYPKPSAPYDVTPFWQAIDDPAKQPVLIHCWGGIHRTGVLSGIYRIERQGWSADDALAEMRLFGFNNNKEKFSEVLDYMHQLEQQVHERTAEKSSPSEQSDASRR